MEAAQAMKIHIYRTFPYQLEAAVLGWGILLPFHLVLSGGGLTPSLFNAFPWLRTLPFYNWYNIPVAVTFLGFAYDQGYLITNVLHYFAGLLITPTFDLGMKTVRVKAQLLLSGFFWVATSLLWELAEATWHFRGSSLDTRFDLLFGLAGCFSALALILIADNHFGYEYVKV